MRARFGRRRDLGSELFVHLIIDHDGVHAKTGIVLRVERGATITGLTSRVSADLHDHFLVVDALGLLDHLRTAHADLRKEA